MTDHQGIGDLGEVVEITKSRKKSGSGWELSEAALSDAFVETVSRGTMRWVQEWGQWMLWTETVWRPDRTVYVYDKVRHFLEHRVELDKLEGGQAKTLGKASTIAAVERLARAHRPVAATPDEWDVDPWLLNTPAGVFDLNAFQLLEHRPERLMTKLTRGSPRGGHQWQELAKRWVGFLDELTDGDDHVFEYLQRLAGYGATGSSRDHTLPFLLGPGGNGKGTFVDSVAWALGDYAVEMPENFLAEQAGERHPTELADLQGARFAVCQETGAGSAWNESRLKALTGGDQIRARRMRQDFVQFDPTHTIVVVGNNPPALRSVDYAIKRRLHVVPLNHRIPKPDQRMREILKAEADGILMWILEGTRKWLTEGLAPPVTVRTASDSYFASQDPLGEWLEANCLTGPEHRDEPTQLLFDYKNFCGRVGHTPLGPRRFGDELEKRGFRRSKETGGTRYHIGLRRQIQ